MLQRLDESKALNQIIKFASNSLAEQRGLVPVIGIGIMFVGFLLLLIQVFMGASTAKLWIEFFGVLLQGYRYSSNARRFVADGTSWKISTVMVSYRIATQPQDMQAIAALEITIWGIEPRDIFPPHMLSLAQHHGGVVLVAEDNNRIIGFCIGFPARAQRRMVLVVIYCRSTPRLPGAKCWRDIEA